PVVNLTGLPFVAQANDAAGQAAAVVGLNAVGNDDGVTPTLRQNLFLPIRSAATAGRRAESASAKANLHDDRHRSLRVRGRGDSKLNVKGDRWKRRIVDMADKPFRDGSDVADGLFFRRRDLPLHLRRVLGNPAVDLSIKVLDDLRPPLFPPHLRGG